MRNLGIFTGTGTHLAKSVALSRALTEAAQARLTSISGNRDDILPKYYQLRGPQQAPQALTHVSEGKRRWVDCADHDLSFSFKRNWQALV
jgi:ribosomal protein S12 methylthiotransferase accessory factor YcaO